MGHHKNCNLIFKKIKIRGEIVKLCNLKTELEFNIILIVYNITIHYIWFEIYEHLDYKQCSAREH